MVDELDTTNSTAKGLQEYLYLRFQANFGLLVRRTANKFSLGSISQDLVNRPKLLDRDGSNAGVDRLHRLSDPTWTTRVVGSKYFNTNTSGYATEGTFRLNEQCDSNGLSSPSEVSRTAGTAISRWSIHSVSIKRLRRLVSAFDCTSLYHYLVRDLDNLDAQTTA